MVCKTSPLKLEITLAVTRISAVVFDVSAYAEAYYKKIHPSPGNNYPRLKAWEFIYEYVWSDSRAKWADLISEDQVETTALHVGFYLANWGMFRGSSGLLQNSNLELMKALAKILFEGPGCDLLELSMDDFASGSPELRDRQKLLDSVFKAMEDLPSNISWTNTLKTKILLGVWGEYPALDRYFIKACRIVFPQRRYLTVASGKGLTAVADAARELNLLPLQLKTARLNLAYPNARIIDMALFQYGLEIERPHKSASPKRYS